VHGKPVGLVDWVAGIGVVVCAALAWMAYWRWKDRIRPEPLGTTAIAFLLGGASAGVALFLYAIAGRIGFPTDPGTDKASITRFCLITVGPIEEGAKFLVAWALLFRHVHFDEEIDGLVYATAVALGFAAVENVLYLPDLGWGERLARAFSTPLPLSHAVFAALWGFGYAHARSAARTPMARRLWPALSWAAAALLHGLYDVVVLAHDRPRFAGALVFALWIFVVFRARRILEALEPRA
jgi:RsiW-degrading membrane proteinase PrsW (M82 family)